MNSIVFLNHVFIQKQVKLTDYLFLYHLLKELFGSQVRFPVYEIESLFTIAKPGLRIGRIRSISNNFHHKILKLCFSFRVYGAGCDCNFTLMFFKCILRSIACQFMVILKGFKYQVAQCSTKYAIYLMLEFVDIRYFLSNAKNFLTRISIRDKCKFSY